MQDPRAKRSKIQAVPSSSTNPSTTTVPGAQTPDGSNTDEHQPAENPDHVQYPHYWLSEMVEMTEQPVIGVEVSLKSREFKRIARFLKYVKIGPKLLIKRIVRVQNKALWTRFYRQKQKMSEQRKGRFPKERRLFHGTRAENIDSICTHGFQISRPAANGRRIGKGHYFTPQMWHANVYAHEGTSENTPKILTSLVVARTSSKSDSTGQISSKAGVDEGTKATKSRTADSATAAAATKPQNTIEGRRYMLLSRVLVGRSLRTMEFSVAIPVMASDYDSCYQRSGDHTMQYAVYNDNQAYPEYVVEYVEQKPGESQN